MLMEISCKKQCDLRVKVGQEKPNLVSNYEFRIRIVFVRQREQLQSFESQPHRKNFFRGKEKSQLTPLGN